MRILVIDNYDSFTYNLVQLLGKYTSDITVRRNDRIEICDIEQMHPDRIVISPGPGRPEDAKISLSVIKELGSKIPILGVCLGHQAIGFTFGAQIRQAPQLMHGKVSEIRHDQKGIYKDIEQNFSATRYHSLIVEEASLPESIEVSARTADGVVMGIRHVAHPIEGVQFHPESVLTFVGEKIIKNWVEQ